MIEQLAQALHYFRSQKKVTQAKLGKQSGVGQGKISRFENQQADLQVTTLQHLCRALDLDVVIIPREKLWQVEQLVLEQSHTKDKSPPSLHDLFKVSDDE